MTSANILDNVISTLDSVNELQCEQTVRDLKNTTKCLYDFTKQQSNKNTFALPELVIEGFDEEQIWQQLELLNGDALAHFSNEISRIWANNKKLTVPLSSTKPELTHIDDDNLHEENSSSEDVESENKKIKTILKKKKHEVKKKTKPSIVDDKFFKLQDLNEYLIREERKEKQGEDDADSDEESVDFFNDLSEEEDEDSPQGKYLKYVDFFDSPLLSPSMNKDDESSDRENLEHSEEDIEMGESDDEDGEMFDDDDNEEWESSNKRVRFNLTNDSDETDSIENKVQEQKEEMEEDTEARSSFEARQERLLTRIKEMEQEAMSEKPWQLKGEISGSNRPHNSLLEEFVEFDVTTRPAPVITEETTLKLEDIIKQRIKDRTWDDVEKKFKPVETPLEYKKKLIMNQEKSKESLSQIYENEYLKQKQALNPDTNEKEEVPELHHEIRREMRSLMSKLDALSNYHYTPKRVKPELKIISNVPAINMEEVAPVATSDAALLAPEEVKTKSQGDIIGKSERTKTDKKRERRRKKIRQRAKQQATEEKEKLKALKPGIAKKQKKEKAALLKQLTKDRNITKSDETSGKVAKSSTAFFTQLQDQVKSQIKAKTGSMSKKKNKNAMSAVKLKL